MKLLNVLFDPRDVFISLHDRKHWQDALLPIFITAVVGLCSMVVLKDLLVEVQLLQTEKYIMHNSKIPDDQKEETLNNSLEKINNPTTSMIVIGYSSSALSTPGMSSTMRAGCSIVYPVGCGGTPSNTIRISVRSPGKDENSTD